MTLRECGQCKQKPALLPFHHTEEAGEVWRQQPRSSSLPSSCRDGCLGRTGTSYQHSSSLHQIHGSQAAKEVAVDQGPVFGGKLVEVESERKIDATHLDSRTSLGDRSGEVSAKLVEPKGSV